MSEHKLKRPQAPKTLAALHTALAQPGHEQRMELSELHGARVADEERFARQLLARRERDLGFTGYADWLDAGCPRSTEHEYPHERIADICFYVTAALTRPTAGLGEDGEFATRLRNWQGDMPEALKRDLAKAADRIEELASAVLTRGREPA